MFLSCYSFTEYDVKANNFWNSARKRTYFSEVDQKTGCSTEEAALAYEETGDKMLRIF